MRPTPLEDRHRALGATMTAFAGWEMPLDYGSVLAEHRAVREHCGVFDLTHLGTLVVTGADAEACVQRSLSNDAAALEPGRAQYSLCLSDAGGIVDDLLVYRLGAGFFVVPNAANTAAVLSALRQTAVRLSDARVADLKAGLAVLAVQGPASAQVCVAAGLDVEGLGYLDCRALPAAPSRAPDIADGVLARSGYTGERGYEVFAPLQDAPNLWDRIVAAGARPAGLAARDTLRLEMGYPLHGNDISPVTSPVEAGLSWAVKPGTGFVGEAAYLRAEAAGPSRRLRGLRLTGRGVPRAHCPVRRDGDPVGETTSGTFSPTLRVGVALGYLEPGIEPGQQVEIDVRGKALPAGVVRPPFVDTDPRR
ncbi:MAG TPA: glycine cleavage system aminomethyltransferase GcvT [Egibacteraceae bacterium]|nr:glycine cleavage system aminomethyltransferase GcvT [Egibacteraceae bacterium]